MWAVVYIATFLLMWSKPDSPPFEGGVDAPSRKRSEGTFERRGRRGCFKQPIIDLAATPSAPAKVASQHFLYGRSHPSLERRGIRFFCYITLVVLASAAVFAQVPPPGTPYDSSRHSNPIITFVENKDFKPSDYEQAKKAAGIELLGLSQSEGKRESVEIADGKFAKNMPIVGGFRTDVTFYPVVRQKFRLAGGSDLLLQSFRFPKVALPKDFAAFVLHEATTQTKKKPSEMRFGGTAPEQLDVRGTEGLLFEKDGQITVYWQEDGVGHTATASLPRKELFRVIEDLL